MITSVTQCKGENSAEGGSTAERFSSRYLMPEIACTRSADKREGERDAGAPRIFHACHHSKPSWPNRRVDHIGGTAFKPGFAFRRLLPWPRRVSITALAAL